jgi:hypothetical protein
MFPNALHAIKLVLLRPSEFSPLYLGYNMSGMFGTLKQRLWPLELPEWLRRCMYRGLSQGIEVNQIYRLLDNVAPNPLVLLFSKPHIP